MEMPNWLRFQKLACVPNRRTKGLEKLRDALTPSLMRLWLFPHGHVEFDVCDLCSKRQCNDCDCILISFWDARFLKRARCLWYNLGIESPTGSGTTETTVMDVYRR